MEAAELVDLAPVLAPFALYELRRGVSALVAAAASLGRIEALLLGGAAASAGRAEPAPALEELPADLAAALRRHLAHRPAAGAAALNSGG